MTVNGDIWTSLPDVFASTANYLSKNGWKADERWGRRVRVPKGFSKDMIGLEVKYDSDNLEKDGRKTG